jgi:hypothetical protein
MHVHLNHTQQRKQALTRASLTPLCERARHGVPRAQRTPPCASPYGQQHATVCQRFRAPPEYVPSKLGPGEKIVPPTERAACCQGAGQNAPQLDGHQSHCGEGGAESALYDARSCATACGRRWPPPLWRYHRRNARALRLWQEEAHNKGLARQPAGTAAELSARGFRRRPGCLGEKLCAAHTAWDTIN